ncbi:MAG: hypothetical protein LAT50_14025, partial [Ectothiorhodospiraceae bacterium]|nr:hypothetical protein [Ectothiorhodospiraceae bacterium]
IDYDFFIGTALRTADKALWCRFPLPSQLYSEKVLANILKEWKEFGPAPVAKREVDDQHFLAANFLAEPPQVAFEDELIRHGNTLTDRTSLIRFIAMTVFMQHRLRQSRAEAEFGTEVIAQARDMAEPEETEQLPMQELSPYKPACLGLIQPSASPECSSQCSFADRCMALRDATSARLKSIHHSEDPWIDEMRAKARERKRRERARKRALKHGV